MAMFENTSVWRYLGMLVLILGMLVGGTWITVKTTTDHLLYQNATRAAQNWAQFLAANVSDLEQIAAGETPSSASMAFFEGDPQIRRGVSLYRSSTATATRCWSPTATRSRSSTCRNYSASRRQFDQGRANPSSMRKKAARPTSRRISPKPMFRSGRRPPGRHRRGLRRPDGGTRQFLPDLSGRRGIALRC